MMWVWGGRGGRDAEVRGVDGARAVAGLCVGMLISQGCCLNPTHTHTHTQPAARFFDMPLRFPIADKYKDMGTCVMGKLEAGTIKKGESLVLLPNKINVTVEEIFIDQGEGTVSLGEAAPGDNIKMKIKGVEEVCPVEVCQLCVFSPQACCCRRVAECHILLTSRRARRIKFGWGMSCAARKACADPASGLTPRCRCALPLRLHPFNPSAVSLHSPLGT